MSPSAASVRFEARVEPAVSPGDDRVAVFRVLGAVRVVVADGAGNSRLAGLVAGELLHVVDTWTADWDPVALLRSADAAIFEGNHGAESAGVVLEIRDGHISGASVGDSGAWLLFQDDLEDLTSRQRRKPLLGSGAAAPIRFEARLEGRLLVATDGLLKYATRNQLVRAAVGELDVAADALVRGVRLPTGALPDDVGLVLAE